MLVQASILVPASSQLLFIAVGAALCLNFGGRVLWTSAVAAEVWLLSWKSVGGLLRGLTYCSAPIATYSTHVSVPVCLIALARAITSISIVVHRAVLSPPRAARLCVPRHILTVCPRWARLTGANALMET